MSSLPNDQRTGADLTPYTMSVLNISTGHIRPETGQALTEGIAELIYVPWSTWGWVIYVANFDDAILQSHPDLAKVLFFAQAHGFTYVQLDCDADEYPGLPTFEW